jgi:MFS family permease
MSGAPGRSDAPAADRAPGRWRALALLAAAELLAMALWFSASASVPSLRREWQLSATGASWLTLAVQFGFVAGTFLSAAANVSDVVPVRRLFTLSAMAAAAVNAAFGLFANALGPGLVLRFLTGFFLAGVYPPGMKLVATWFRGARGAAIGVLVGALTVGKASPYLINGIGAESWRANVLAVSIAALLGGALVHFFVREGPYALPTAPFDAAQVAKVFRNRGVRLANFGYFGHMWELYAMWSWLPVMIRASLESRGSRPELAEYGSFLVLGAGAAGCVVAGLAADRIGRTVVTSWAMAGSGLCCATIGLLFGAHPAALLAVAAFWGATVVADSAQFSACVTELGDPQYLGTALTLQTCIGFLLTTASVALIPAAVDWIGWRWAFALLAPGPALGIWAMLRLRALPEAVRIAQGRR